MFLLINKVKFYENVKKNWIGCNENGNKSSAAPLASQLSLKGKLWDLKQ